MSKFCCHIGVWQQTGGQECNHLNTQIPKEALLHGLWWDAEWQPASYSRVSSHTPAPFLHTARRPLNSRGEEKIRKSIEGTYSGQTFKSGITDGTEQVTSRVSNSWSASATLLLTLTLQERKMTMSAVHKTETDVSIPF